MLFQIFTKQTSRVNYGSRNALLKQVLKRVVLTEETNATRLHLCTINLYLRQCRTISKVLPATQGITICKITNNLNRPVTILTGFLGVGKTTFLNHLLQHNKDTRYAIIENEFGEQGIDSELIIRPEETIVELNNGCLCCTLNDNLYDILNDLFDRKEEFDEIIIEATGVADPTGLAQPFLAHPLVKKYFPLKGIICLVDAELVEDQLKETEEVKSQLAYSDLLLINKTDLVSQERVENLKQKLHQLNPLANIAVGNKQAFPEIHLTPDQSPLEEIFEETRSASSSTGELNFPISKSHTHHHHKHTEEIVSHTFYFDQPFDDQILGQQLTVYLMLQSEGLYRMKGLVWIDGAKEQYLVQSVGKRLDVEKRDPWPSGEKKRSVVVFIGKNLERHGIEKLLNKCISKHSYTPLSAEEK